MFLIDFVGAINQALPRLIGRSADQHGRCEILGPNIGRAFLRVAPGSKGATLRLEEAGAWSALHTTTVGILGSGPVGAAVARVARSFGADVSGHDAGAADTAPCPGDIPRRALNDVLAARVICVALPWHQDIQALVQKRTSIAIDPDVVLVVWKRSAAIERALVHLGQHYLEPVQLRALAEVAGISRFHLVRLFTATLGITPHRYQTLLRLSRAMSMLREGTGITHIAHGVGFADHSHLDRNFRVLMGMTPTQYQQRIAA
ncbi:MAG: helix-turn-helix domain-containing protein [Betaproteobacteria bacterium]